MPVAEHPEEIVFHPVIGVTTGVSWEPIKPGLAAEDTETSHDTETTVAAAGDALAAAPDLYVWDRAASAPVPVPPDAYSLRLVAARTLYDAGRTVSASPSLAPLAPGAALIVHPTDLSRVGVVDEGAMVRVTSARGTIELPVRTDTAIAPGTCFIPFAQGDPGANDLIDVTAPVTELRVETTR